MNEALAHSTDFVSTSMKLFKCEIAAPSLKFTVMIIDASAADSKRLYGVHQREGAIQPDYYLEPKEAIGRIIRVVRR